MNNTNDAEFIINKTTDGIYKVKYEIDVFHTSALN